jgi:hypothetical protein
VYARARREGVLGGGCGVVERSPEVSLAHRAPPFPFCLLDDKQFHGAAFSMYFRSFVAEMIKIYFIPEFLV